MYALSGPSWTLPILVKWLDPIIAEVVLAQVPLLKIQVEAADKFLTEISHHTADKGRFYVIRSILESVAEKAAVNDPEAIVEWVSRHKESPEREDEFRPPEEFIRRFCQSYTCPIRNPVLMDYVWASLCKFMLHCLVVEAKPVDLYFCRLIPLQIRKNWAPVLAKLELDKRQEPAVRTGPRPGTLFSADPQNMIRRGITKLALSDQMTGITLPEDVPDNGVFRKPWPIPTWTLECLTGTVWEENTLQAESLRQDKYYFSKADNRIILNPTVPDAPGNVIESVRVFNPHGRTKYFKSLLDQMKRQLPDVLLLYAEYLKKATQKMFGLHQALADRIRSQFQNIAHSIKFDLNKPGLVLEPDQPGVHGAVFDGGTDSSCEQEGVATSG